MQDHYGFCALRVLPDEQLQSLLRSDDLQYKVIPVSSYPDLTQAKTDFIDTNPEVHFVRFFVVVVALLTPCVSFAQLCC